MKKKILFVVGREIASVTSIAATETEKRCEKALKEWKRGGYEWLLISALEYEPGGGEPISASGLMAEWFVAHDIPRRQIFVEDRARDVYDNVQMGYLALQGRNVQDLPLTVVTEFFNAVRCWILFLLLFRKWTSIRPMFKWLPPGRLLRELMIVAYLFYDPRGIKRIAQGNREMKKSELI
jgi:hypothetical protein